MIIVAGVVCMTVQNYKSMFLTKFKLKNYLLNTNKTECALNCSVCLPVTLIMLYSSIIHEHGEPVM